MNKEEVTLLSIVVNLILTAAKIFIGTLSRSTAIIAEGIHSGMDIVTSVISFVGVRASKKPSDKEHPYGHDKSETVAGFIITVVLFISSVYIIYEAVTTFLEFRTVELSVLALSVMGISAITNLVMSELKMKYGKKHDSMALIADAKHSRMDVFTSAGVFAGLIITGYWPYADSIMAVIIGLYIMKSSISLGKETTDSLLNISAGDEIEGKITRAVKNEGIELWDLKTQKLGSGLFAELRIGLDPKLNVEKASMISNNLEKKLKGMISQLKYVVIQIESHKVKKSYYKGGFGNMEWKGRMGGFGRGPAGECICPKCGHKTSHQRGQPCYQQKCPKCGTQMTR